MLCHHKLIAEYATQKNVSLSEVGMGLYSVFIDRYSLRQDIDLWKN